MRKGVVAAVLVGLLTMSSCGAPAAEDYSRDTAGTLQAQVWEISRAAASGDLYLAEMRLNELIAIVRDSFVRGWLSEARRDSILAAITLVRLDLERAIFAQEQQEAAESLARDRELQRQLAEAERVAEAERLAREQQRTTTRVPDAVNVNDGESGREGTAPRDRQHSDNWRPGSGPPDHARNGDKGNRSNDNKGNRGGGKGKGKD